jgi:hypothetical protein
LTDTSAPAGYLALLGLRAIGHLLAEVGGADEQPAAGQLADDGGDVVRDVPPDDLAGERRGGDDALGAFALGDGEQGLTEHVTTLTRAWR